MHLMWGSLLYHTQLFRFHCPPSCFIAMTIGLKRCPTAPLWAGNDLVQKITLMQWTQKGVSIWRLDLRLKPKSLSVHPRTCPSDRTAVYLSRYVSPSDLCSSLPSLWAAGISHHAFPELCICAHETPVLESSSSSFWRTPSPFKAQ